MHVLLDGQPLDIKRPSLAEALRAGIAAAGAQGRIIIEVKADGQSLPEESLEFPSDDVAEFAELRLTTADPRQLVRVTLLDAVEALESARAEQMTASELLATGKIEESLGHLQTALATWQAVRDVVSRSAAVLRLRLDNVQLQGVEEHESLSVASGELNAALTSVKTALTHEDWSALSDVLAYDLEAQARLWKRLLTAFADHVMTITRTGP
jgi:hypothetical protein